MLIRIHPLFQLLILISSSATTLAAFASALLSLTFFLDCSSLTLGSCFFLLLAWGITFCLLSSLCVLELEWAPPVHSLPLWWQYTLHFPPVLSPHQNHGRLFHHLGLVGLLFGSVCIQLGFSGFSLLLFLLFDLLRRLLRWLLGFVGFVAVQLVDFRSQGKNLLFSGWWGSP